VPDTAQTQRNFIRRWQLWLGGLLGFDSDQ